MGMPGGDALGGMGDSDVLGAGLAFGPIGFGFAGQNQNAQAASWENVQGMTAAQRRMAGLDSLYSGYIEQGEAANLRMTRLFEDPSYIRELPGYQFRMEEGIRGTTNKYSQKGGLFSGEAMKALVEFSQGYAEQQYQAEYERLLQQQEIGLKGAQGKVGVTGIQAEIDVGIGQAKASQYVQQQGILAGEIGFGRQIFGQWSGAMAGAASSSMGSGMGG